MFNDYLFQGIILFALFVGIPLVVASFFGFIVSFLQATTQIQEQSIVFFIKLASVFVTFILLGPWMIMKFRDYFIEAFYIINLV